jgi:hypothetical protein
LWLIKQLQNKATNVSSLVTHLVRKSAVSFTPRPLYPWEKSPPPIFSLAEGRADEEKNSNDTWHHTLIIPSGGPECIYFNWFTG